MARYKGKDGAVEVVKQGAASTSEAIGEVESFDLEISVVELEANVMGEDWTGTDAGQKSATGTVAVLSDPADTGQARMIVGDKVTVTFYPEGNTTSLTQIQGSFLVTNRGQSTQVGSHVKTTYSIKNDGAVTITPVA